jgi:hypothetical protein
MLERKAPISVDGFQKMVARLSARAPMARLPPAAQAVSAGPAAYFHPIFRDKAETLWFLPDRPAQPGDSQRL